VNGRRADIPSFLLRVGDTVQVRERSKTLTVIQSSLEGRKGQSAPEWLDTSAETMTGKVLSIPSRDSIAIPINEQLIVELYSK
jgi:small subunit ribosomal protein S4